jgi:hypothetical protein
LTLLLVQSDVRVYVGYLLHHHSQRVHVTAVTPATRNHALMPNNQLGNDNTVSVTFTLRLFGLKMVKIENVHNVLIRKMYMRKVRFNDFLIR